MVSSSGGCHCICGPPALSGTYADCCLGSWRSAPNLLLKTASDFPLHLEQTPNTRIWFTRSCRIRILSNSPTPFGVTSLLAPATLAFLQIHPTISHLRPYVSGIPFCPSYLSLYATPSESIFKTSQLGVCPYYSLCTLSRSQLAICCFVIVYSLVYLLIYYVSSIRLKIP